MFESSGLPQAVLKEANNVDNVIESDKFKNALFLNQYNNYYKNKKQIPIAIEVPIACVVTSGPSFVSYSSKYFSNIADFDSDNVAYDDRSIDLLKSNFNIYNLCGKEEFLNNEENTSPVLLTSTMMINEVRETLTKYGKEFVYYNNDDINCRYIYEWSIGDGNKAEIKAAEKLLSWMLGIEYQDYLMISECSDGQIPVNKTCFESKLKSKNHAALSEIYKKFVFKQGG